MSDLLGIIADGIGFLTVPAFLPLMWQRSDLTFRRLHAPPCWLGLAWNPNRIDAELQDKLTGTSPARRT